MVEFDPYDWATCVDPYPIYRQLRDSAPVYHNEDKQFWALSRYDDVAAAHLDTDTYRSSGGVTIEGREAVMPLLIVKDPPDHTWHRKLVNKVFTPRRIAGLEPFIRSRTRELLDRVADRDEFDVVTEFSVLLPLDVISELIGIPADLRPQVHELSNRMTVRGDPDDPTNEQEYAESLMALLQLYLGLVQERHANPREDVITQLMTAEVIDETDGTVRMLRDDEVAMRFLELGFAGHETVALLIPSALIGLRRFPDQRSKLLDDPGLVPNAVEEFLRWDPPSHLQGRTISRDVELHAVTIPAGQRVMLLTAAASRDERAYDDPDRVDITRQIKKQLGFGIGPHVCLGAALARLETRVALEEILARFPDYTIDESRAVRQVQTNVRGLSRLPLRPTSAEPIGVDHD
ncbi:MAG TPA: cytochrome P450 [Pseudonocardiaceae bacterium]|jgi:cytochrome P450